MDDALFLRRGQLSSFGPGKNPQIPTNILRKTIQSACGGDERKWDLVLPYAVFCYNQVLNRTMGDSPHFLLFGSDPQIPYHMKDQSGAEPLPLDEFRETLVKCLAKYRQIAQENLATNHEYMKRRYDQLAKIKQFRAGQIVYLDVTGLPTRQKKIKPQFRGPFKVLKILSPYVVQIRTVRDKEAPILNVNVNRVKLVRTLLHSGTSAVQFVPIHDETPRDEFLMATFVMDDGKRILSKLR